ncbi:Triosephosphate isomerase [Candidatus Gugararchaeum adminiculabundum]|nr:Triosephosphate isomerase [Candidatus Gugararchaeum adminiculabundum]
MKNLIALNLKVYSESLGQGGLNLALIAAEVAHETGARIVICPQTVDLAAVCKIKGIDVFAQHVDANKQGAFTGSTTVEAIKSAGAKGSLINHAEKKQPHNLVKEAIDKMRALQLESLACSADIEESKILAGFRPNFVAVEPPELIGSGISVSSAKPEVVTGSVKAVKQVADVAVLCGAGISTGADVKKAIELGTCGVLLASAYVKAKDPKALLRDMARNL